MSTLSLNKLSEKLLLAVKMQKDTFVIREQLQNFNLNELQKNLDIDDKKKAFWINIYNAYFQIIRKEQQVKKPDIYRKKLFSLAQQQFSLDDVEHGILRKYRYKYSLGFFANIFTKRLIKKLAVGALDYRIHFALNCGAKSCPPIAFYNVEKIDFQLNLATQSFLESESEFNDEQKVVHTTALFQWFLADFGGMSGIKSIYKNLLNKDVSDYKIKYKEYSWEEDLDKFA